MQTYSADKNKDLLNDLHDQDTLIPATRWQRMANLLLDIFFSTLFFCIVYSMLYMFVPVFRDSIPNLNAIGLMLLHIPFFLYYVFLEVFNQGRTVGKMLTRTYAVQKDGTPVNMQAAILRTIIRVIPFEVLSGLRGECWHDKWSDTTVVKE